MIELHSKVPDLLKVNDYVIFRHIEEKYSQTFKANVYYKVRKSLQVPYTLSFIIPSGDTVQMKLSDYGLYPERPKSLYEILIGFGGSDAILNFVKIPETDYHLRLEKAQFEPNPLMEQLRYLGEYSKEDSSIDEPRLVIYTVKDFEEILFEIYNDGSGYGKIIIHSIVNICELEEVKEPEKEKIPAEKVKEILHYKLMR